MADEKMAVTKKETQTPAEAEHMKYARRFIPAVDIYENKEGIVLLADMPGVNKESVDINLEKNILTITGRVDSPKFEGYTASYAEYQVGDFERSFTITEAIDRDKIQASVKDGELRLIMPKSEKIKPKKIEIKVD